jgi:outer membrane protein OmpA-like peptidoglycan-associated protein
MIRWDATGTGTFCIVNTEQTPVTIQPITITPSAPTMANELRVTSVRRNATCSATGGTAAVLPQTLQQNQILVVTVTADPEDRTGLLSGTLTVTSDLLMNPTRTISLTAMSTTAMLTTMPGLLVDFGDVDRDGPPAMRMLTIMNSGTAPLDLSGFARNPMTGPFTFTLPGAQTVQPGGTVTVTVTYTPVAEQAPNQFEQVVLSHNIGGILGGPTSQMITIRGRGVDRHIALDAAPAFPDTFRNPGSAAPVRLVTVRNTGEAPLSITGVMLSNEDVWQLLDASPVTIPANGSHSFMVRFVPKVAGKAPVGQLTFMNNDNSTPTPMAIVLLNGNGIDRSVMMGEPEIPFGLTAIGIPVTIENKLTITSMDPANGFTIRAITLDDTENFAIEDAPMDVSLGAQQQISYSVTFTPTTEGVFETRAHLFLDEDPTAQADVILTGQAVFVDVDGGGGCSAGGGGAGLILGLLGLAGARRRRVARVVAVAAAVTLCALPAVTHAEPDLDLDLSLYNPTPTTTGNNFQIQPASVGDNGDFAALASVSYATNPLVLKFAGSEHGSITQRTTMELGLAYAFLGRFEAGVRMPLFNQSGDGTMVGVASPSGTARGDAVLHGKLRFVHSKSASGELHAGVSIAVTLPTATDQQFAGVDKPTGRVLGLLTYSPSAMSKRLSISANLGAVIREASTLSNIEQGSGAAWGVGTSFRVLDQLWIAGELFGDVIPGGRKASAMSSGSMLTPTELLAGISYRPDPRVAIGLAVGRGLIAGPGTPDLRGVASISYVPGTVAPQPLKPVEPPKADGDADKDGVANSLDRCVNEAEDADMFDDTDGCPDFDNDADGFLDPHDKCPLDAEDNDSFQDDDGCPEKDNDADGINDAQDKCADQPEDKDGYEDVDGCPEDDNDSDGMIDGKDGCPNEPETINGNTDDDGCPDRGDALVVVTPSGVEIIEAVQFNGTAVSKASTNVLNQIGATLRAHQEIVRLKIVVHVQPTGDDAKDQDRSDKRAAAVRDWLVQWGISPNRLSVMGLGGTKPLVPAKQKNSALINDRVELIILERK